MVAAAYGGAAPVFGPDYIIPKPFDPRLILEIAPAVARAAMDSGVARRPITDFAPISATWSASCSAPASSWRRCSRRRSRRPAASSMARARTSACCARRRRWWMTASRAPILLGRRAVIERKVREMGLRIDLTDGVRVLDPARGP